MKITKSQISKIENWLKGQKPRYEWSSLQRENEPWRIIEIKNGKRNREIESKSTEGKKLIKEGRVKYPKGGPVLILD